MAVVERIKLDARTEDELVAKFPHESIALGSQLIVNESQEAIFVRGGQALDLFGPGTYTLSSANLPVLRTLVNLPFGGKTPFSAEVWFINKTVRRGLKWGTKSPVQVVDPKLAFPFNVRAFGEWGIRIKNSRAILSQVVGTRTSFNTADAQAMLGAEIVQRFSNRLARFFTDRDCSVFELNTRLNDLAIFMAEAIAPEFDRYGIELSNFNVERISIPDEEMKRVQGVLGRRLEFDQLASAHVSQGYIAMRSFDALAAAAGADSGAAALLASGLGLGLGAAAAAPIARVVGEAVAESSKVPQNANAANDPATRLQALRNLLDQGLIDKTEYDEKRKQILAAI